MLEQIVALLVSLAVAAAGAVGIDNASTVPHGVGTPEIASAKAALARQAAAERLAAALDEVEAELDDELDGDVETADAGLDTAATAISESPAWEAAGGAADFGLDTAHAAVTSAPTDGGDPEDEGDEERPDEVPPVTPPTAPPTDVPSGSSDAPGGRP